MAARAPAIAPAEAAALPDPPPAFFRCIFPLPPSGTEVFAMVPPRCRTGVLPCREDSEFTSDPSVLPMMSGVSSPFMTSPVLLRETTLSGRLNMSGEGVPEMRPPVLGLFRSGSFSLPFGLFLRFLLFFFTCCSCCAFLSACFAKTTKGIKKKHTCIREYHHADTIFHVNH